MTLKHSVWSKGSCCKVKYAVDEYMCIVYEGDALIAGCIFICFSFILGASSASNKRLEKAGKTPSPSQSSISLTSNDSVPPSQGGDTFVHVILIAILVVNDFYL